MKKAIVCFVVVIFAVFGAVSGASALGEEEKAIARVITAAIKAQNDFTTTKDVDSVMKHYHPQVISVSNLADEEGGYAELKGSLEAMREGALVAGGALAVSLSVGKLSAHVSGDFGWAIFEGVMLVTLRGGQNVSSDYTCTDVLKKTDGKWLIIQEHCSYYKKNN